MIQDEREGGRGRGVVAGGGESKSKERWRGGAVTAQPANHASLRQLQLRSFLLFLLLGPSHSSFRPVPPFFLSSLHFPPLSLRPALSVLQCVTNSDRENGYNSSLQLPDATLNFAKKHPLMDDKALARPLLLTKGVNFTRLAVDRVSALDQRSYNMLFIGTGTNNTFYISYWSRFWASISTFTYNFHIYISSSFQNFLVQTSKLQSFVLFSDLKVLCWRVMRGIFRSGGQRCHLLFSPWTHWHFSANIKIKI